MHRKIAAYGVVLAALPGLAAADGYALAGGVGARDLGPGNDGHLLRFAVSREKWRGPAGRSWRRSTYGELAITFLREDENGHRSVEAIGGLFATRLTATGEGVAPYVDVGIGPNWFSATRLNGIEMSTRLQFGSFLGVGARFGAQRRYELGYRAMHLSNASIKEPNPGLNYHVLTLVVHQ